MRYYVRVDAPGKSAYVLTSGGCGEWTADFFNNRSLSGVPVVSRCDSAVDFAWGSGSPDPLVSSDSFSARWTQVVSFAAGTYTFSLTGDDGIRLLVDGVTVVDGWKDQASTTYTATVSLEAGEHTVVVVLREGRWGDRQSVVVGMFDR